METYVYEGYRQLLWKFYSTSDGRTVDWSTTGLENKKDPPDPIYEENADLAKGEIKQVDWAVEGATVTIIAGRLTVMDKNSGRIFSKRNTNPGLLFVSMDPAQKIIPRRIPIQMIPVKRSKL